MVPQQIIYRHRRPQPSKLQNRRRHGVECRFWDPRPDCRVGLVFPGLPTLRIGRLILSCIVSPTPRLLIPPSNHRTSELQVLGRYKVRVPFRPPHLVRDNNTISPIALGDPSSTDNKCCRSYRFLALPSRL